MVIWYNAVDIEGSREEDYARTNNGLEEERRKIGGRLLRVIGRKDWGSPHGATPNY